MHLYNLIKNNAKTYIILAVVILIGVVGVTLAAVISDFNPIAVNTTTSVIDASVTYDESDNGSTITSNGNMLPIDDADVTLTNNDPRILKVTFNVTGVSGNPDDTIYDIALHDANIDCDLRTEDLKWRLYKNDSILSYGSLSPTFDTMANNRLVLTNEQEKLSEDVIDKYTFLLWISETCTGDITECDASQDQSKYLNKTLSAAIKVELSTKSTKKLERITGSEESCYYTPTEVPSCNILTYNGGVQTLVNDGSDYTLVNSTGTKAGTYAITAKLNDGYKWSNGETDDKILKCDIDKKDITVTTLDQTIMYGNNLSNAVSNVSITNLVSGDSLSNVTLSSSIADVGEGIISTNNIVILDDEGEETTYNYFINKNNIGKVTIECANIAEEPTISDLAYTGSEQTGITNGHYITITGVKAATEVGSYNVSATPNRNYCWSDKSTTAKEYTWNIVAADLNVELEDKEVTYTGEEIEIDEAILTGINNQVLTGIPVTYKYFNGNSCSGDALSSAPSDVGIYSVKAYTSKYGAYSATESNCAVLTITKADANMTVNSTSLSLVYPTAGSFTYTYTGDGTLSCTPGDSSVATCSVDTSSKKVTVTPVNGGSTTITLTAQGGNYNEISKSVSVTISYDTYVITLDEQGATTSGTSILYGRYADGIYLYSDYTGNRSSITCPIRTGYTFDGYYTNIGGAGTQLISSSGSLTSSFTNYLYSDDVILYAKWTPNKYTVTLNNNDASSSGTTTLYYIYDDGYYLDSNYTKKMTTSSNPITIPIKTGYVFDGYNQAGSGRYINASGYITEFLLNNTSSWDIVLNAVWIPETYTITYDANGGDGAPDSQTKTYAVDLALSEDVPTREGYRFLGWSTNKDATSATYEAGETVSFNNDIYLYAVWQAPPAYAVYSSYDNSLTFYKTFDTITKDEDYNGKVVTDVFTGFETASYSSSSTVPWYSYRENITSVLVDDIIAPKSTAYWFYEFKNCTEFDLSNLDTSSVTSMSNMFYSAGYNSETFELVGLGNWDTSSVTSMYAMFDSAGRSATEWSIGDLGNWDTSSVKGMGRMFYYAGRSATEWNIGDLGNWDTSSVTSMSVMFYYAGYSATEWSIGDLSNWDTSSVENMLQMFSSAGYSATEWSIGNLSDWDTSSVTDMSSMFFSAGYSATEWSIGNLSDWDTSSVTDMRGMFWDAGRSATEWNIGNLSTKQVTKSDGTIYTAWDTSSVTDMSIMFNYAGYSATVWSIGDLSDWDTSSVTYMNSMFSSAGYSATEWSIGDLSGWDISSVTDMSNMFLDAGRSATEWSIGDLSGWDTSSVTNMGSMFSSAGYSATEWSIGDLSDWDTSSVTNMGGMFSSAGRSATEWSIGDLSGWDTSSVTNMSLMFSSAGRSATEWSIGDLSNWDTSSVTSMYAMFDSAGRSATEWSIGDLSTKQVTKSDGTTYTAWDTSSVTSMNSMFYYAGYTDKNWTLDLSSWTVTAVGNNHSGFSTNVGGTITEPNWVTTS